MWRARVKAGEQPVQDRPPSRRLATGGLRAGIASNYPRRVRVHGSMVTKVQQYQKVACPGRFDRSSGFFALGVLADTSADVAGADW
jgi:hypothetical protein